MTTVFAETFYFLALLNNTDQGHIEAAQFTNTFKGRRQFEKTLQKLHNDPNMIVIQCERGLFSEGIDLYKQRLDK